MARTADLIKALQILDPEGKGFVEADHDILYLPGPRPEDMDQIHLHITPADPDDYEGWGEAPEDEVELAGGYARWSPEHDSWIAFC
jgi:hypothetical protein